MSTTVAPAFGEVLPVIDGNDLSLNSLTGKFNIAARRHPIYLRNAAEWRFLYESYKGGAEYLANKANLKRHTFEKDELFLLRWQRAYYLNYCAPIIDSTVNHLFKGGVIRENVPAGVQDFYYGVNDNGADIDFFMRDAAVQSGVFGKVAVLVDMPRETLDESEARRNGTASKLFDLGKLPRLYTYTPLQILDWSIAADGLNWVLLTHDERDDANPLTAAKSKQVYQLWDRQGWTRFNKDGVAQDSGEHGLGIVPLITFSNIGLDQNSAGESSIKDIAHVNNGIYNLCSLLDEIFYRQAFSQLVVEGQPGEYNAQVMSTAGAFCYPLGRKPPSFISSDAAQAELHMRQIDSMIGEIYRMANIRISTNENRQYKTAIQSQYDFESFNSVLKNKARACEKFETDLNYILSLWLRRPEIDKITVKYPAEFDTSTLADDITDAVGMSGLGMGKTFMDLYKKKIVKKRFPDVDVETVEKIAADFTEATASARLTNAQSPTVQ